MAFAATVIEHLVIAFSSSDASPFKLNGNRYENYTTQAEVVYPKPEDLAALDSTRKARMEREQSSSPGCSTLVMRGEQYPGTELSVTLDFLVKPETVGNYVALIDTLWTKLKGAPGTGFFNLYEDWDEVTAHAADRYWANCKMSEPPVFPMPSLARHTWGRPIAQQTDFHFAVQLNLLCESSEITLGTPVVPPTYIGGPTIIDTGGTPAGYFAIQVPGPTTVWALGTFDSVVKIQRTVIEQEVASITIDED